MSRQHKSIVEFKFDTQLLVNIEDKDVDDTEDELREYILTKLVGDSLVLAGFEDDDDEGNPANFIKIHFHTNEPWKILEYCNTVGEIYDIVVEDMIRQSAGMQG